MFDALLNKLETDLRTAFDESLLGLVATARTQLDGALAEVARERAKGLADVCREKEDLYREIKAMHKHKEAQEGHVVLNIGGYRYETSVQALRRLPHTFFDAYFSGRYAQDVCADGSIFIDRDGKHFGQVLQYLRDGAMAVAEQDASELDIGMLRGLKREFDFYCIELVADQQEMAFAVGGAGANDTRKATIERYDIASGKWREMASMATSRSNFALLELRGELYAIGGMFTAKCLLTSVERYDPSLDCWSAAPPLPLALTGHCAVAVGNDMYVMGGVGKFDGRVHTSRSVLKFDSHAQTWSEVAPMPEPRAYAGACVVGSNIHVLGGKGPGSVFTATSYRYNMDTDAWSTLAPMPQVMRGHCICAVGGLIYVLGGMSSDNIASSAVHSFDPVTNCWSAVTPMLAARVSCASFVLNGSIHVAGGRANLRPIASVERHNAASNTWTEVSAMTQARQKLSAHTIRVEMNVVDSLVLKAKAARR
jgi:N-acetylneuraminic acid mutarotase